MITSRAHRIIDRITQIWSELDYAQRRLIEIRTGVQLTRREIQGVGRGLAGPRLSFG